jgi:hypothetical protein
LAKLSGVWNIRLAPPYEFVFPRNRALRKPYKGVSSNWTTGRAGTGRDLQI